MEEVILEASQTVHLKRLVTVDILVALLMHQVKALALAMATTVTCLAVPHKHLVKASGKKLQQAPFVIFNSKKLFPF